MPIKLNQTLPTNQESTYNNDVKTYSGFYFDTLGTKAAADSPWTSIAINESDGHMLAVSNTAATTGTNALVYSSNGGETWTNITLTSGTNNWKGITFGAGRFVGVTASGSTTSMRVLYSSGTNQAVPTLTTDFSFATSGIENNNWEAITYGNGYFVAVASSGTNRVMISLNGVIWISINSSIFNNVSWDSIAYSPELRRFVIVSNDGSGRIAYSNFNPSFSSSWFLSSNITSDLVTINFRLNTVIWSSKLKSFIAAGNNGKIISSLDGITWTTVAFNGTNNFQSIIWSQELELIALIASTGTGTTLAFTGHSLSSTDSNIWTARNLLNANTWTTGIWNRKYGSFVILSSNGTTNTRILVSRISGKNHFLEKRYYYDLIENSNLLTFNYYNSSIRTSIGSFFNTFPILSELNNFIFSCDESLPTGITLNSFTGEINGTPTVAQSNKTYKILATSGSQVIFSNVSIYISNTMESISNLEYSNDNIIIDLIDEINLYPIINQGTDYTFSYSIIGVSNSNSFPYGINFNTLNGFISGIPTTVQPNVAYRITVQNSLNSVQKIINLTVRVLNTVIQGGDLRGDISTEGEWLGYVSYFYNNPNIIGGKIEKNYFYDNNAKMVFNNILTLATRRIFYKENEILYYKKELIFTVVGNYTLNILQSLTLNSYTFSFSNATKQLDVNGNTQFIWLVDDLINYFPIKDNIFYITGINSLNISAPSALNYTPSTITPFVGSSISSTPVLTNGYSIDYSISPQLPLNYLSINEINGNISGTTLPYSNDITYTITARNTSGSTSTTFRIRNIYSNSSINTGYNNINNIKKEGFINSSIGSIINNSFGSYVIESIYYEWSTSGPSFSFIISGGYFFPEIILKSIKIGLQSDSTKFIVNNSTYNSGTGRGYNYSNYSNYEINNKKYTKWTWNFPGPFQSGIQSISDYGWILKYIPDNLQEPYNNYANNWITRNNPTTSFWGNIGNLVYSRELNIFVAFSGTQTTSINSSNPNFKIINSIDGVNWNYAQSLEFIDEFNPNDPQNTSYGFNCATWSPELGIFIAIGRISGWTVENQNYDKPFFIYSSDGINWKKANVASNIQLNYFDSIAWSPELGIFIIIGVGNNTIISYDGKNWLAGTKPVSTGTSNFWSSIIWSSELNMFVIAARRFDNLIMYSYNGIDWNFSDSLYVSSSAWRSITWSPELNLFVAISVADNKIIKSSNGINWTISNVTFNGSKIIWVSQLNCFIVLDNNNAKVIISEDAISWTAYDVSTTLFSIDFNPELGLLVAAGGNTTISNQISNYYYIGEYASKKINIFIE
jgi:hypothetical protein